MSTNLCNGRLYHGDGGSAVADERRLVLYPSDILRFRCTRLETLDTDRLRRLVDDLTLSMKRYGGVGMAAPQLGAPLPVFVFVHNGIVRHVVNPEVHGSGLVSAEEEGCLSVPGLVGLVPRFERVHLSGVDVFGNEVSWHLEGLSARIVQHEYDHVQGILFLDRVVPGSLRPTRLEAGAAYARQF